tara:strand:+ start:202 stop:462 length:261 start_codon:yes stop_codon:yes gene_type:complete
VVAVVDQIAQIMQEDLEDPVVEEQIVEDQELVILHQQTQHKVQLVERALEQLLQVGQQEEVVELFVQVKPLKVQMGVMVVMVVDYL